MSWACVVARVARTKRSPAGIAGAGAKAGVAPFPVPNASPARPTTSSWARSPEAATTTFAGR